MRLTQTLLSYLNRVFSRDPLPFVAFSMNYDGAISWAVDDGFLIASVVGGSGADLSIDLSQYTIGSLTDFIATKRGYSVTYLNTDYRSLGALVLLDAGGSAAAGGNIDVSGYTSLLYCLFDAISAELEAAQDTAVAAPAQLSVYDSAGGASATGSWLDELGSYFGTDRNQVESDVKYAANMAASLTQIRCNNVAMEIALEKYTGQPATVTDVVVYAPGSDWFGGGFTFDGSHTFAGTLVPRYGLFDVSYDYDFGDGADPDHVQNVVTAIVMASRATGTYPRTIAPVPASGLDFSIPGNPYMGIL